jgi:hypothetical protein
MRSPRLSLLLLALALVMAACGPVPGLRPVGSAIEASDPSLGVDTLVSIGTGVAGHRQVQWRPIAALQPLLPLHLDRPDARPLQVSVDAGGQRLVVLRERKGQTELVLHDRRLGISRPLPLAADGLPVAIGLSADGRSLAVAVSRDGRRRIEVLALP